MKEPNEEAAYCARDVADAIDRWLLAKSAAEKAACVTLVPVTFHEPASPRISSPRAGPTSNTAEDQRVAIQAHGTGAGGGGRNRT